MDPATIKAIVQMAAKVATDPEIRNKVLYIVFGGLAGLVVVILIPIYILTNPLELLKAVFAGHADTSDVEQFKADNDSSVLTFDTNLLWNTGAAYPMPLNGMVTSGYGERDDPTNPGNVEFHTGIDIQGAWHANVDAIADGVVIQINTAENSYGNTVLIQHTAPDGSTFYSFYAHLSQIYMMEGQAVKQGAVIGLEGGDPAQDPNPEQSTGHHLHFEIRAPGPDTAVDPGSYIFPPEATTTSPSESEAPSR